MGEVPVEEVLRMINQRLERLENKVDNIDRRVARLEADVDNLVKMASVVMKPRNSWMKWFVITLGMILSFIATLFGLGWRPPR